MLQLLIQTTPSFARGEYQTALELYGKKQYPAAAQYFEIASIADPTNVSANYYAGYCFYLAGKRNEAVRSFWRLARAFPSRKEGLQAREYLKKIDPDFAKNSSGAVFSANSGTHQTTSVSTIGDVAQSRAKPSARSLVNNLVSVKRSAGKNANVSNEYVEKIKELLVTMPLSVLLLMRDKGGSVMIVSSVVEHDMRIQNTVPRGWDADFNWKDSPALTHGKQVVVSQYRNDPRTGEVIETSREIGVVRHEFGHAIDHCLNDFTESAEFKHAHYLDAAKVPDEYRAKLDYYLQRDRGGPSETFAELYCYSQGGETDKRQEACELVKKYFLLCDAEMQKQLAKLEQQYGK
jgi:tetratricopeptide (TPR) repeat protein